MCKKLALVSIALLGFSAITIANEYSAIYVGGQFGESRMNYSGTEYTLPANSVEDRQYAMRFYAGYSFTELLAAELGYGYYGKNEFKHQPDDNRQDMLQQGIDLFGRINLPLDYGFGFYVKAGGIWLHRQGLESRGGFFAKKEANGRIAPAGGFGLTYNFTPQWNTEIFWTGNMSNGNLPRMYFYGVGFTYKFIRNAGVSANTNVDTGFDNSAPM